MDNNSDIISISQGQLKGQTEHTKSNFKFHSFLGIPYAKPPVGKLRFKNPEPAEKWKGIRDATKEGDNCYSNDLLINKYNGSEDCLYLNIYTPALPTAANNKKLHAVMVWIHGGGFTYGSSKRYQHGPEYLINKDIVLVTFNYRLGALGYLCLHNETVPGNNGMHDQVLALKWVQENIAAFGGDPNNVTIFGQSAGAASVHLHMLSRMSSGLFHKAIMQSGAADCPWALGQTNGLKLAELLGKNIENKEEALKFLQDKPCEELIQAQNIILDTCFPNELRYFIPVIEQPHEGPTFLHDDPETIIQSGCFNKVPVLLGYNSGEGQIAKFIELRYGLSKGSAKSVEIAKKIKQFYFGDKEPNESNKQILYKIISHSIIVRNIQWAIKQTLKKSSENLYFYILSLDCELNQFSKFINSKNKDVSHVDDLFYLFYNSQVSPPITPGSVEDLAIQRMTKWWSNFAKYGNPNGIEKDPLLQPEWPKTDSSLKYLDINSNISICTKPEERYMNFWKSIDEFVKEN